MKKRLFALTLAAVMGISGCGQSAGNTATEPAEPVKEASTEAAAPAAESTAADVSTEAATTEEAQSASLPPYYYPGDDGVLKAISDYLTIEIALNYDEEDVCIPTIQVIDRDEKNPDDIVCYGTFWIDNFALKGDILESASGGNYPGVFHLKKDGDSYTVTSFDVVEDGSDWDPSAKKLFGDRYDALIKVMGDEETRKEVRTKAVADYVAENNLAITAYQDYGWDPVELK